MKILINDRRKIFGIKEEFNAVYPFLKLEFFSKPQTKDGPPSSKIVKFSNKTLGECRTEHNTGEITIDKEMTVSELEQRFGDVYGLGVRILRKSGNVWIETIKTKNWTLEAQNSEGGILFQKNTV